MREAVLGPTAFVLLQQFEPYRITKALQFTRMVKAGDRRQEEVAELLIALLEIRKFPTPLNEAEHQPKGQVVGKKNGALDNQIADLLAEYLPYASFSGGLRKK